MKKIAVMGMVAMLTLVLSGCEALQWFVGNVKEEVIGRNVTIQTYDEDSQIIDRVKGNSVSISPDNKFAIKDSEGDTVEKSGVLNITVGGKQMLHVGSSMIAYEDGLSDIFTEYATNVNLENMDRSVPFINKMVNEMANMVTGKQKVILIRSQSGKPLATFAGDKVSYYATDIDKATGLLVDGKYLFIYRSDYTIYDTALLK